MIHHPKNTKNPQHPKNPKAQDFRWHMEPPIPTCKIVQTKAPTRTSCNIWSRVRNCRGCWQQICHKTQCRTALCSANLVPAAAVIPDPRSCVAAKLTKLTKVTKVTVSEDYARMRWRVRVCARVGIIYDSLRHDLQHSKKFSEAPLAPSVRMRGLGGMRVLGGGGCH